jgi:hypothetical protein
MAHSTPETERQVPALLPRAARQMNLHMHDLRREAGSRLLERAPISTPFSCFSTTPTSRRAAATSSRRSSRSTLTIQRIDAQRRASGEASKWAQELAEMKQNLQEVPQKCHKLVESTAEQGSKRTATARKINPLGA